MEQSDLWGLLPKVAQGRRLRDQLGVDYLQEIGSRGGQSTVNRYGRDYMRSIARKGGQAKWKKVYSEPATIKVWDSSIVRRVPWWPHQKNRQRRKKPVLVRIELDTGGNV